MSSSDVAPPDEIPGESIRASAPCPQCGGRVANGETCADRFAVLLALDHSRQQPWGTLHGVAFSVYTLQHSDGSTPAGLNRCWSFLQRVYTRGEDPVHVAAAFRAIRTNDPVEKRDELPNSDAPPRRFDVTISDMGDFELNLYQLKLNVWCIATMKAWNSR